MGGPACLERCSDMGMYTMLEKDMGLRGVVYIAYGWRAVKEAGYSIATLRQWEPELPIAVIGERVDGADFIPFEDRDSVGRWAKVNLDRISPFETTWYLDADTRIHGKIEGGFRICLDGWDIAVAPSPAQGGDALWHVSDGEREATIGELGYQPLQLQGGVFFFRKCEAVGRFFAAWREEWSRWKGQDQGALLRALHRSPVRMWVLGRDWNGGALVEHRYGAARVRA